MIIKKSDEGTFVQWLQMELIKQGFKVLNDGFFSDTTEDAVKRFQAFKHLPNDGVVGGATIVALKMTYIDAYRWNGTNRKIAWVLPSLSSIPGLTGYNVERGGQDQFATRETVLSLLAIGKEVDAEMKTSIQVGDVSRLGGGHFAPHSTHRNGDAADVRPLRKDGKFLAVTCTDSNYDRAATEQLIHIIKRVQPQTKILFNDEKLIAKNLCRHCAGHYNHLHLQF